MLFEFTQQGIGSSPDQADGDTGNAENQEVEVTGKNLPEEIFRRLGVDDLDDFPEVHQSGQRVDLECPADAARDGGHQDRKKTRSRQPVDVEDPEISSHFHHPRHGEDANDRWTPVQRVDSPSPIDRAASQSH